MPAGRRAHRARASWSAPGPTRRPKLDLRGVRTQTGDYVVSDLAERVDTDPLVGDIITHWLKYAAGVKTIVFAVNVAHSRHIASEFVKAGVKAEHLDGNTPKTVRDAILGRLAAGDTEVVVNCKVLTRRLRPARCRLPGAGQAD